MTSNRFPQFNSNNHPRSFRRRSTRKEHDPRPRIRERRLQQPDRNAHRNPGTSLTSLVALHGPRVLLQLLQHSRQAELALAHGEEEPRRTEAARGRGRVGRDARRTGTGRRGEAEHLVDLLGGVLLRSSEHERFGTFRVA